MRQRARWRKAPSRSVAASGGGAKAVAARAWSSGVGRERFISGEASVARADAAELGTAGCDRGPRERADGWRDGELSILHQSARYAQAAR